MSADFDTILFDLDGTLTDPGVGITKAVFHALTELGVPVEDLNGLKKFIGPPLEEAFPEYYGLSEEETQEAIRLFRTYYDRVGWLENIPYRDIEPMLKRLRRAGKRLLVATSKPEEIANRVLVHFGLSGYFDAIYGALPDAPAEGRKAAVIDRALARSQGRAVMVGDRRHDIEGAHTAGLPAIGVLYGYGSLDELREAGAEEIVEGLSELEELLMA